MISVEAALGECLALVSTLTAEQVGIAEAAGRYLQTPVTAKRAQPPFDASAMDGYALACHPTAGAQFEVIGATGAGHHWQGQLAPDQALRIFTGAPLPQGALRVVIQEDVTRCGNRIEIKPGADEAHHIRPAGQDFLQGTPLSPRILRPNDLGLLAAMGHGQVFVTRKPVVALIATGDELVMPTETPNADQITASSIFTLKALVEAEGGLARILPIARDNEAALETVLSLAAGADIIVTMGGASVGDHDLVGKVTQNLGLERRFWRIAMRPGKPLMAGKLGQSAFLGLPGNPVSAVVCAHLFLRPMIRACLGLPLAECAPRPLQAELAHDLPENGVRAHYMRAKLTPKQGLAHIHTAERQDSALLGVLAQADALLIRPAHDPMRPAGTVVSYLPL